MVPSFDDDAGDVLRGVEDDDGMMVLDDGDMKQEQPQYCLEKYFSNGDITSENRPKRRHPAADRQRYAGSSSDEDLE